jgi:hypothetical protein
MIRSVSLAIVMTIRSLARTHAVSATPVHLPFSTTMEDATVQHVSMDLNACQQLVKEIDA